MGTRVEASAHYFYVACDMTNISVLSFQCALDTAYWTGFNHFVIWGSILFYFGFIFVFYSDPFDYTYLGVARNVMSTANFWFTLILTVTVLLVPVVAERFYYIDTRPTLTDKVRLKQKISKSKSKSGEFILRRHSTMRRSQRSLRRSGYAFAHSEGFGRLITSGANMPNSNRGRRRTTSATAAEAEQKGTSSASPKDQPQHQSHNMQNSAGKKSPLPPMPEMTESPSEQVAPVEEKEVMNTSL